ncbi:MAG TPA: NAD(P)-dependent oxidoreductase [Usitatibacter sp.]|nr:NAD(P)-dependent oxidoreductase [Usitatibacter sp.]
MKVGIAGTGRMGAAIAGRLMGLGHEVTVWNRTPEKTRALAAAGAHVAGTPSELADRVEIAITILTDSVAIDATYAGTEGLLARDVRGKLFVEMSTVRPGTETALAAKVRSKGAAMVDCPVGGSVGPAKEGKLLGFLGGEEADVARARPVLEQLCRRVEHVGPVGAGARMKLAINLPLLVYWEAFAEALALIAPLGLDPARVVDILADTSGGPNVLKSRGTSLAAAMRGEEPAGVTVDVETMRKDLRTMLEEARAGGIALPVTARTLECYDEMVARGQGGRDITAFATRKFVPRLRGDDG